MRAASASSEAPVEPARLDELMLAMDVVDTLRHERDLVLRELAGAERADALVARLREIYAGQGIEVSDHVLREGVAALEQDRFVYVPPPRSLSTWLATVYVTRRRWAPIFVILLIAVVGSTFAVGVGRAQLAASRDREVVERHLEVAAELTQERREYDELAKRAEWRRSTFSPQAATVAVPLLLEFDRVFEEAGGALASAEARLAEVPPPVAATPQTDADLNDLEARVAHARRQVDRATSALRPLDELFKLDERGRNALALVDALDHAPSAAPQVADARASVVAAIESNDESALSRAIASVEQLRADLNRSYTLRIVSRQGVDTGFWRASDDADARNYYIVLEAVASGGDVLTMRVLDEESQRVVRVKRFAQRVPKDVFDRVFADKTDNGLVDEPVVGHKRRGELVENMTIATAGGRITRW